MSRDIRRVPLDFDWPLNKVWGGYLMPKELRLAPCPDCSGGYTPAAAWLNTLMYRLGMLVDDVTRNQPSGKPMHPWLARDTYPPSREKFRPATDREKEAAAEYIQIRESRGEGVGPSYHWVAEDGIVADGYEVLRPSGDILELVAGLGKTDTNGLYGMLGISSSVSYQMAKTVIEAAGLDPETWGTCPTCGGSGEMGSDEQRAAVDTWERTDPPTGEGWQLWESVSEGSPISPVFADREGLIHWLTTDYTWGAQKTPLTRSQAEAFVGLGHSIGSGVIIDGEMVSGEAAVERLT